MKKVVYIAIGLILIIVALKGIELLNTDEHVEGAALISWTAVDDNKGTCVVRVVDGNGMVIIEYYNNVGNPDEYVSCDACNIIQQEAEEAYGLDD